MNTFHISLENVKQHCKKEKVVLAEEEKKMIRKAVKSDYYTIRFTEDGFYTAIGMTEKEYYNYLSSGGSWCYSNIKNIFGADRMISTL